MHRAGPPRGVARLGGLARVNAYGRVFVGRQPILDRHERIVAFELLFRASAESQTAGLAEHRVGALRTIANTFATMGADAVLGTFTGFINVDRATLLDGPVEALPRDRVAIEILESVEVDEDVRRRCRWLRESGFSLALDDYVRGDPRESLLDLVDTVKVDLMAVDDRELDALVEELRVRGVTLLAEKVESRQQFERCRALGFDLYQGYYFARPTVIEGRRIDPGRVAALDLLRAARAGLDPDALAEKLARLPGLFENARRLAASAAFGSGDATPDDAMARLLSGQRERWLHVLLYAGEDPTGLGSPLLQLAAKRGRLMELLVLEAFGGGAGHGKDDRAFVVGAVSLAESLLDHPMSWIARELDLDEEMSQALVEREGRLGGLLRVTEALERGDFVAVEDLTGELGISPEHATRAELAAFRWVNDLARATPAAGS